MTSYRIGLKTGGFLGRLSSPGADRAYLDEMSSMQKILITQVNSSMLFLIILLAIFMCLYKLVA